MSLFVSGAATILQTSRLGPIGSGLLSIQGTSFTFIAPVISTAGALMAGGATATEALGVVFGLCLAGALIVVVLSRFIQLARAVITPIVTGTVVTLIGLTLIEVGMVNVGGGFGAQGDGTFGSLQNLLLAGLVMGTILGFNASRSPSLRMLSVVIGLAVGYVTAALLGRLDLAAFSTMPAVTVPQPFRFGLGFAWTAFIPFIVMYLITVMESIGDLTATSSLTGQPISGPSYLKRLRGGLLADGISSAIGASLNSFPSTTFAQNNGVIQLTGVGSRYVGMFVGGMLMVLGLIPAVGVLVQALPPSALGRRDADHVRHGGRGRAAHSRAGADEPAQLHDSCHLARVGARRDIRAGNAGPASPAAEEHVFVRHRYRRHVRARVEHRSARRATMTPWARCSSRTYTPW